MTHVSGMGWRDAEPDQFAATVLAAAEQVGVLPLAVEKDCWACRALRAITINHPGEVVFKQGSYWRRGYLAPALTHSSTGGAIADASAILLELGQSGGSHPSSDRPVQSLLARQLDESGFDTAAWSDLATFDVAILHPSRTLIEKLLRVNNFASDPAAQETTHGWPRVGRQFYDIWAVLGTEEVLDLLADNTLAGEILASCYEVSKAFTPDRLVPAGGFAASGAFVPDGPLAERLGAEHDVAMRDLYYGTDEPPSFDDVLDRVQANQLLDFETQR